MARAPPLNLTASIGNAAAGSASGLSGISASGDQLFVYQGTGTTGTNPNFSAASATATFSGTPLYLLNYASAFLTTGAASAQTTYLPSDLNVANGNINFATALTTRGEYTGSRTSEVTLADFRTLVNDPSNWTTATGLGNLV